MKKIGLHFSAIYEKDKLLFDKTSESTRSGLLFRNWIKNFNVSFIEAVAEKNKK